MPGYAVRTPHASNRSLRWRRSGVMIYATMSHCVCGAYVPKGKSQRPNALSQTVATLDETGPLARLPSIEVTRSQTRSLPCQAEP